MESEHQDLSAKKWVLVTGANSGIGEATVNQLAEGGWNVLAGVRREDKLDHFSGSPYADSITTFKLDVTDDRDIERIKQFVSFELAAELYAVVHNAGIFDLGPVVDKQKDRVSQVFDTNVFSIISLTRALLPSLKKLKGRVVLISSDGGLLNFASNTLYCMTKHAVEALGEGLAEELRHDGVSVSIIQPGNIATPIFEKAIEARKDEDTSSTTETEEYLSDNEAFMRSRGPHVVAEAVTRALTDEYPQLRYTVMELHEMRNLIAHNIDKLVAMNQSNDEPINPEEFTMIISYNLLQESEVFSALTKQFDGWWSKDKRRTKR
ncbi:MAG: SDR family NAD(P)-dependent oxidoreductase [Candidatus Kariarchaeaceae archaeon]